MKCMIPFDLDSYIQSPDRPLCTRDGSKARIICVDRANSPAPIVALIKNKTNKTEDPITYYEDGRFLCSDESPHDLFFDITNPGKHEGWVNLLLLSPGEETYENPFEIPVFDTALEAHKAAKKAEQYFLDRGENIRYRSVKIEWED